MPKEPLKLLNRHSFINRHRRQSPSKFMGMYFWYIKFFSYFAESCLFNRTISPTLLLPGFIILYFFSFSVSLLRQILSGKLTAVFGKKFFPDFAALHSSTIFTHSPDKRGADSLPQSSSDSSAQKYPSPVPAFYDAENNG